MHPKDLKIIREIKTIEPATTIHDEGNNLCILIDLPGIEEDKIRIELENHLNLVTIVAAQAGKQYKKVISVPCEVRFSKRRFADGVLELTLRKITSDTL